MKKVSAVGDLTDMMKEIEKIFVRRFGSRPALAIAFTLAEDRKMCHWVTNVSRDDGVDLFQKTAAKMIGETN